MKKITYFIFALSLLMSPVSALEKRDCAELKKLSKAFMACKSHNLKAGLTNAGSKIKKNTIGKIKKNNNNTNENSEGLKEKVNKKAEGIKKKANEAFSGHTKQYPKGIKK